MGGGGGLMVGQDKRRKSKLGKIVEFLFSLALCVGAASSHETLKSCASFFFDRVLHVVRLCVCVCVCVFFLFFVFNAVAFFSVYHT